MIQNHDQIGNRLQGERSATRLTFEQQKLAAAVLCLSPYLPLLFMGEEYGETAPLQYFVSHGDQQLLDAIRKGRCQEFASFGWSETPPDPAAAETFARCTSQPELRASGQHQVLQQWYTRLLQMRASLSAELPDECVAFEAQRALLVRRRDRAWLVYAFSDQPCEVVLPVPRGSWQVLLSSVDAEWQGPGRPGTAQLESTGEVRLHLPAHSFLCCGLLAGT